MRTKQIDLYIDYKSPYAYLAVEPNNRLIKPIMKWLVYNRKGGRWKNTRDTAKAVYALSDYIRHSKELSPNYKLTVQVNGKMRGRVEVAAGAGEDEVVAAAQAVENVARHLDGKTVRKIIHVPDKLLNLVVG